MYLNRENLKCHLKGKTCRILANGQNSDNSEKKKSSAPTLGLYTIILCLLVYVHAAELR